MKRKKNKKKSDADKLRKIVYKYNMRAEDVQTIVDLICKRR